MARIEYSGRFDPVEVSDPALELGNLRNLTFYSSALQGRGDVSLFVPPLCEELSGVPLILLLHGVYGSHWSWFMQGAAHRTAQRLIDAGSIRPMILASPSDGLRGDGTGYLPYAGADYERWVTEDVVDCVRQICPCIGDNGPVMICGLSMGGYGAMRLGMKYPELFRAISAHSSITHICQFDQFMRHSMREDLLAPEEAELLHWAKLHVSELPPLRFDCGRDDPLFSENRKLHEDFRTLGIVHDFDVFDGAHSWQYWTKHLENTLLFFEHSLADKRWVSDRRSR